MKTNKKRSTAAEEPEHDTKPEGVSKRAKKAKVEDQNKKDLGGRKETRGVMITAESGGSLKEEEKPKPSRSRATKKPAAEETGKDGKGKRAGQMVEKKTEKKKGKMEEEEEEDQAKDGAEGQAGAEGPAGEGKVSKKKEKREGEGAPKPKKPAASFARRPCPKNNEWSKQRWQSLRDSFELKVKPHLIHYSKHEVRCLKNVFLQGCPNIINCPTPGRIS